MGRNGWGGICVLLGLATLSCGKAPHGKPAPNVIIVTLDTLRADHLHCYGYARETSPALDSLAAQATRFADATCAMPTTLPSHLNLFTGLSPRQLGVLYNGVIPPQDALSLFEIIKSKGYTTAGIVSAKVLDEPFIAPLGLDEFYFGDGREPDAAQVAAEAVTTRALRWLERRQDRPFALWLHYFDPHEPYTPPPPYDTLFTRGYQGSLPNRLETSWLVSLNKPDISAGLNQADKQHIVDLYDGEIRYLDDQLNRIFTYLKTEKLWDDSLIIVTGDHGQAHGETGFYGHGERLIEPVVKIPLIVKLPNQRQGRLVSQPVAAADLLPSLSDYFGWQSTDEWTGISFAPALEGREFQGAAFRLVERRHYPDRPVRKGFAVYDGPWKYTLYVETEGFEQWLGRTDASAGQDGPNLFEVGHPRVAPMLKIIGDHDRQKASLGDLSEETRELLRSLGYTQ